MLLGAAQGAWNSSHTTSIEQAHGRCSKQAHGEACMLWQRVERVLTDARELRIAYLLFHCGLTPREIVQRCTPEFTDVQEVLSLRCAIMQKLISIDEMTCMMNVDQGRSCQHSSS